MSVWHGNPALYASGSIVLGPKNASWPMFTTGSMAFFGPEDRTGQLVRRRGHPDHEVWLVRESDCGAHVVVNQFEEKALGELAFLRGEWEKVAG